MIPLLLDEDIVEQTVDMPVYLRPANLMWRLWKD